MRLLRSWLRRGLSAVGLHLLRSTHPSLRYVDHHPGCPLDFLLLWLLPDLHGTRFLQIGAHDGQRNDPLYRWVDACGWQGCLVEPMPDYAQRLSRLYSHRPDITVLECAIADRPGSTPLYRIDSRLAGLPSWAAGVATLDYPRALEAAQALGLTPANVVAQSVRTMTVAELLSHFPSGGPNVVAIDTEGYDLRIVAALLDTTCRPRVIHFEHACAPVPDWWALLQRLHALGYEFVTHGADTTAFRRP